MNTLKEFVIAFCLSSILIGALFTLAPKDKLAKSVKFLFCLIYLCCILSSISVISKVDFEWRPSEYTPASNEKLVKSVAEEVIKKALENEEIEFTKVEVFTDISADGSIVFNEVTVYSSADPLKIKNILGDTAEYAVTVINE